MTPLHTRLASGATRVALACLAAAAVLLLQRLLAPALAGQGIAAGLAATAVYGLWLVPIALWLLGAADVGAARGELPGDGRARYRRVLILAMSLLAVVLFVYSAYLSISTRTGEGAWIVRLAVGVLGSGFLASMAAVAVWPAAPLLAARANGPLALLAAGAALGTLAALPFAGAQAAFVGALLLHAGAALRARAALARIAAAS